MSQGNYKEVEYNLFGDPIMKNPLLRDKFIEPPFSILDTKSGSRINRKKQWLNINMRSETGRDVKVNANLKPLRGNCERFTDKQVSIFDPALCEVLYHWFCSEWGTILDPFAWWSVRGIVANYLGYKYTGIDIRQEQVDSNREQAIEILSDDNHPIRHIGDSNIVLDTLQWWYDFVFSCPPYADLEVYSDLEWDISNMEYDKFMIAYKSIIKKSCNLLKEGWYACFIVGEVRDKKWNYIGFVPDTIKAFMDCGMKFYNEGILLNQLGNAAMRASNLFPNSHKLIKVHQNILVFKKY